MPTTLDSIKKLHPARAGWEFATLVMIAIAGVLTTLAVAAATSLDFIEMPF